MLRQLVLSAILLSLVPGASGAGGDTPPWQQERQSLDESFRQQLAALADRCDQLGLAPQAHLTRAWFPPRLPDRQYLFLVPGADPARPDERAEKVVAQWYDKFLEYRRARAERLWQLARRCLSENEGTAAYQLLHELLREDPDHAEARRVLGYRRAAARWIAGEERLRAVPGKSAHARFGWRRNEYWGVESPHFRIVTSHSPQAALALAAQLEDLHCVWRQVFFPLWSSAEALRKRCAGRAEPLETGGKHEVVLFRNREEYLAQLGSAEPQIGVSLGYYAKNSRIAFFYAGDESLLPTRFHEATHQLLQERGSAVPDPGERANFWIVEGVALYMESLARHDGYCTLGGFDADRLQFARARRLSGDFYMPLADLVRLGREDLQRHAELRRIYTQAAGLTHFLMDGQQGRFRGPLLNYLAAVYAGRDSHEALASASGFPLQELDRLYPGFLEVQDADLQALRRTAPLRNLSLGRTSVTDAGLESLATLDLRHLEWLDLSYTKTSDAGIEHLRQASGLRQLNLESTRVTDRALATLGCWPRLEELDLSHTAITDAGLSSLEPLKRLKVLWLTGTRISDAAVPHLERFRDLEVLDAGGTRLSEDAWRRLRARLPRLRSPEAPSPRASGSPQTAGPTPCPAPGS